MNLIFAIFGFIFSCLILSWLSSRLVKTLTDMARYLRWREFIVAFFVMAFAGSLPNLFVGLSAALRGMPEISFGDIVGGNLVDLTIITALAVFFGAGALSTRSEMVRTSAIFTALIALLPIFLVFDGKLSRADGLILIFSFFLYSWWLFSKDERFKKTYRGQCQSPIAGFKQFLWNILKIIVLISLLLISSQLVVASAQYFSGKFGISLSLIGLLIVGLGNSFPEAYFSIVSARKGHGWLVLGDLMGSVIVCATLVLGIIALVSPLIITDLSPFFTARIFTVVAAILFLVCVWTGKKITKKEGILFLSLYILFLLLEIFS